MALTFSAILVVIITFFVPPLGVFAIAGCGADLFINIALTLLGYFPGHIHAFYVEYVYYSRRETVLNGGRLAEDAGGIYSRTVQSGGFGTLRDDEQREGLVAQQGQGQGQAQRGYGTV